MPRRVLRPAAAAALLIPALAGCGESGGVTSTPVRGEPAAPGAAVGAPKIPPAAAAKPSLPANSKLKSAPAEQL